MTMSCVAVSPVFAEGENATTVEVNNESSLLNAIASNTTVKLTGNISVETISIGEKTGDKLTGVTLDLNGCNFDTMDGFYVYEADLTIIDSSDGNGQLIGTSSGISNDGSGTVVVSSGTVTSAMGDGINNSSSGTVNVSGGTVTGGGGGIGNNSSGTVTISGGTVSSSRRTGIINSGSGKVNVSGGTVNCRSNGIINSGSGKVNVSSGKVTGSLSGNNITVTGGFFNTDVQSYLGEGCAMRIADASEDPANYYRVIGADENITKTGQYKSAISGETYDQGIYETVTLRGNCDRTYTITSGNTSNTHNCKIDTVADGDAIIGFIVVDIPQTATVTIQ